ncbi:MAG: Eco57I restriction-modification methylase domain-containing protein [Paludibacteraceae bacterium]|nr:Eco57I restriction-modification methylase domain-containing protein [Paludibacteraceae bacterium]
MENSLFHNVYNPDVLSCIANLSNDEVFTPPELANKIIDMLPQELFENPDTTFLDPCCKSGVFLREIAKRLIKGLEQQIPDLEKRLEHIFSRQLYGIAITELTSLLSRRSVYCSKFPSSPWSAYQFPEDKPQGNIIYQRIKHTWKDGKCIYCGASQSEYDRGSELETYAYQFIHNLDVKKVFNMKFDVIIGNPPYQMSDGGNGASAKPLYHYFVERAKKLNPKYLTMIIPSRWFAGGKGLDDFRETMLSDLRVVKIVDYVNAKDCFAGISLGGGVCYFLWDRDNPKLCEYTNIHDGQASTMIRNLSEFPVFVRYNEAISVIKKVLHFNEAKVSEFVGSRNPFGLPSSARGKDKKDSITLYSSGGIGYINRSDVTQGHTIVDKYKVMISKVTSEHAGEPDKNGMFTVLSTIKLLRPYEVCTDSYLIAFNSDTETEAMNFVKYMHTKFFRFLLLQAVSSINLSKDKFQFIPMQNFDKTWTDEMLYSKYNISENERLFIENVIKEKEMSE